MAARSRCGTTATRALDEARAVDDRRVVERVAHDEVFRSGERRQETHVGGVPAREDERRWRAPRARPTPLELDVLDALARDEPGRARPRRAGWGGPVRQPEVVVRAERELEAGPRGRPRTEQAGSLGLGEGLVEETAALGGAPVSRETSSTARCCADSTSSNGSSASSIRTRVRRSRSRVRRSSDSLLAPRRLDLVRQRHRRQQHGLGRYRPALRNELGELRAHDQRQPLEILFGGGADDTVALARDTQLDCAAIHAASVTGWFGDVTRTQNRSRVPVVACPLRRSSRIEWRNLEQMSALRSPYCFADGRTRDGLGPAPNAAANATKIGRPLKPIGGELGPACIQDETGYQHPISRHRPSRRAHPSTGRALGSSGPRVAPFEYSRVIVRPLDAPSRGSDVIPRAGPNRGASPIATKDARSRGPDRRSESRYGRSRGPIAVASIGWPIPGSESRIASVGWPSRASDRRSGAPEGSS